MSHIVLHKEQVNTENKNNLEQKNSEEAVVFLPKSFELELLRWPELKPLLEAFAHRDSATFMHSVAVHFTAKQLVQDLFLYIRSKSAITPNKHINFYNTSQETDACTLKKILDLAPFWLLHDIGKSAADKNKVTAQQLVHPHNRSHRPDYDRARHWIHPQMSGSILDIWTQTTSPTIRPFAQAWSKLSYLHDKQLNQYLTNGKNQQLQWVEKTALFVFSLADTAMAIGLPRLNKPKFFSHEQIKQTLQRTKLKTSILEELFANLDVLELSHFIIASILDSLSVIQRTYPISTWTHPTKFLNHNFQQDFSIESDKSKYLDFMVLHAWDKSERYWEKTMVMMYLDGVFTRTKNS